MAADGGIFAFGDARFHGSTGAIHLDRPVVGMAPTADGGGYWLVAADGGVFTFGDATFHGLGRGTTAGQNAVAVLPTADGGGTRSCLVPATSRRSETPRGWAT